MLATHAGRHEEARENVQRSDRNDADSWKLKSSWVVRVPDVCVLMVEDEALIRHVMAESLNDAGYDVLDVADGPAAIDALCDRARHFTVLVTDFHMKRGLDGFQVANMARHHLPRLPVIIASGRPEIFQQSWKTELDYNLLKKPYLPSQLVALVRYLLEQAKTHRAG